MKVGEKKPVELLTGNQAVQETQSQLAKALSKKSSLASTQGKSGEATDSVQVQDYSAIQPSTIESERKQKIEALKKQIQEGGVKKYLDSVPLLALVEGLDNEVDTSKYLFGLTENGD